jgi:hypothetical protein
VNGSAIHAHARDQPLGCSLISTARTALPYRFDLVLGMNGSGGIRLHAESMFHERYERHDCRRALLDITEEQRNALLLGVFGRSETVEEMRRARTPHAARPRPAFLLGFVRYFRREPLEPRYPTRRVLRVPQQLAATAGAACGCATSRRAAGLLCTGRRPRRRAVADLRAALGSRRVGAAAPRLLWHVGIEEIEEPEGS